MSIPVVALRIGAMLYTSRIVAMGPASPLPVHVRVNRGGTSISLRVDFADGTRFAFKPDQTNDQTVPRYEVAAYRIASLLGIERVPPAVPLALPYQAIVGELSADSVAAEPRLDREVERQPDGTVWGEASVWIPHIEEVDLGAPTEVARWQGWLTLGRPLPPQDTTLAEQISTMLVFDYLVNNPDRFSGGNIESGPGGRDLYYMDNTMAFALQPNPACANMTVRAQRFSRSLYLALEALTPEALASALAAPPQGPWPLLGPREQRGVLERREAVLSYVNRLIAGHGSAAVLVFP